MKYFKLTKYILVLLFCAVAVFTVAKVFFGQSEFEKKYSRASAEIKSQYQLENYSLKMEPKDENSVGVVLGDINSQEFVPNAEINKWNGEAKFKIKPDISNIPTDQKKVTMDGDKINYETSKVIYQYYNKPDASEEGGFEFSEILKVKPDTNVFETPIETENLDFLYQPALNQIVKVGENGVASCTETECLDKDGNIIAERPENVVGSYAVYYADGKSGDYSQMGGKNYKTGKAFHIFRPQIIDANGNKVWGELNIDTEKNKLAVTVPQDFLDKAAYPVTVDPTFGYAVKGGSTWLYVQNLYGMKFTAPESGTVSSISHCLMQSSGTSYVKYGLYLSTNLLSDSSEGTISGAYDGWVTQNLTTPQNITSQQYVLAHQRTGSYGYYDTNGSAGQQGYVANTYANGMPSSVSFSFAYANQYSIYATYSSFSATNTEFISVVDTGNGTGTDYTSLSAWEAGVQTDLTVATTKVFDGTKTGTISDNATVTGATSGATATVVHANAAGTQLLLERINGDFQSGEQIRVDTSNYFATSNAGDQAIAVAKCRASTGAADTTAVTIDGWTTSATNYIKVWTDPSENYRHQGKWDESKYRLAMANQSVLVVSEENIDIDGLQIHLTTANSTYRGIFVTSISGTHNVDIYNNIVRGDPNSIADYHTGISVHGSSGGGIARIWNNIVYDVGNKTAGIMPGIMPCSSAVTYYIYNNTVFNSRLGFYYAGGTTSLKNNLSYNNGVDYSGSFGSSSTHNLSKDATAPAYGTYYRNATVIFADETSKDFHLAQSDAGAKNKGTSSVSEITELTNDIDSSTRTGTWDIGADEAAIQVFYSVGQNTTDHKTGSPTLTIASGVGTFSVSQTATNMGVGDKVTYNTTSVAYISEKVSNTTWKLITATGGTPTDVGTAQTVNSIAHAFASLSAAEAGAEGASYLNANNLVTNNYQLNIPCYYDSGADTTAVAISGWTTGSANYIKIYAPNNTTTEVNQSQRHSGKWDEGKYRLNNTAGGNAINIQEDFLKIDGLQIKSSSSSTYNINGIITNGISGGSHVWISNNIIVGAPGGSTLGGAGIEMNYYNNASDSFRNWDIWNNIIYGFNNNGEGTGIRDNSGDSKMSSRIYNNTVHSCRVGIAAAAYSILKNNISYNNANVDYLWNPSSSSTNNLSEDATAPAYGTYYRNATVIFADETNNDFHLAFEDASARGYGANLSADTYFPFTTDIDNQIRSATWDIGADQYQGTVVNSQRSLPANLENGLIGYWSFDAQDSTWTSDTAGTTNDLSGNNYTGTLTNMLRSASPANGKFAQAFNFDGVDDYASAGDINELDGASQLTLSAWIYRVNGSNNINIEKSNNTLYAFGINASATIYFKVANGQNSSGYMTFNKKDWVHLTMVFDGTQTGNENRLKGYIDGVPQTLTWWSSLDIPATTQIGNSANFLIGRSAAYNTYSRGKIDEVRLYNRPLSADEVGQLYEAGRSKMQVSSELSKPAGLSSGLVGHWSFDAQDTTWTSSTAGTTSDLSGNGNTGTMTNMSRSASPAGGVLGQGLRFDGINDYVAIPQNSNFNLSGNPYTISFQANINSELAIQRMISWYDGTSNIQMGWTNDSGYKFYLLESPVSAIPNINSTGVSSGWHSVIATSDGAGTYRMYIDGVLSNGTWTAGNFGVFTTNSTTLYIGINGSSSYTRGVLDDVRIYNRELSADEIADLYKIGQAKILK